LKSEICNPKSEIPKVAMKYLLFPLLVAGLVLAAADSSLAQQPKKPKPKAVAQNPLD
jgi:hypothetical protein